VYFVRPLGRGELIALDALIAVGYVLALVVLPGGAFRSAAPVWLSGLIVAAMAAPLAVRRLWPRTVFAVVLAASVLAMLLDVVRDSFVAAAFALYVVALTTPSKRRLSTPVIGALSAAGILFAATVGTPAPGARTVGVLVLGVALLGGAWTLGRAIRDRRAYAARAAEQLAERAVADERLRIARELHDVVAHSVGVIAVKAAVANHVAETRPAEMRDALRVIETASRGALTEMRHLLGVLRSEDPPSRAPQPDLTELAERAAQAGVRVDLDIRGVEHLPDGVRLAMLRIVQEAVTNVMKHAAPANARVSVNADGQSVTIDVVDDGPGRRMLPQVQGGHGLIGMRERVAIYGGTFTAGPRVEGGFALSARLPYGE
jgi:signal transduction histidine kinase